MADVRRDADEELSSDDEEIDEQGDAFPTDSGPVIAADSLSLVLNNGRRPRTSGSTVATTAELASSVGSVMMAEKEAFLKSFTFLKKEGQDVSDINWGLTFQDKAQRTSRFSRLDKKSKLYIDSVNDNGMFALSRIREGDYLKSINGRKVGPSLLSGEMVLQRLQQVLDQEGVVSVSTKNKEEEADDVLVHATIIKPRPEMNYEQLGMVVWYWGYLCIKEIKKDSIFRHTVLRETDNIIAINESTF